MPASFLISVILVMIVVAASIFYFMTIAEVSEDIALDDACRASVEAKSRFKTDIAGSPLSLKCSQEEIVSEAKTKEEISLELTQEMYSCWYKYGEGQVDWLSDWDFGETDFHCRICSRISYGEDHEDLTFGEFYSYLNNKKIPGKDISFAGYFSGNENAVLQFGGSGMNQYDAMDLDKSVYVVYTITKFDQDRLDDLQRQYASFEGGAAYGMGSLPDEVGSEIDPDLVKTGGAAVVTGVAGTILGFTPVGWIIAFGALSSWAIYELSGSAEIPYYSLALLSADDIAGMCSGS